MNKHTIESIIRDFPAGAAFICGFCLCLLIVLLLLKTLESASPDKDK